MRYFLYRHYDDKGCLLYIGLTKNPSQRFAGQKNTCEWFARVSSSILEDVGDDKKIALDIEKKAIISEKPKMNINGVKNNHTFKKLLSQIRLKEKYAELLKQQAKKNKQIIKLRNEGWTFDAIAEKFQISRQRVHQIYKRFEIKGE